MAMDIVHAASEPTTSPYIQPQPSRPLLMHLNCYSLLCNTDIVELLAGEGSPRKSPRALEVTTALQRFTSPLGFRTHVNSSLSLNFIAMNTLDLCNFVWYIWFFLLYSEHICPTVGPKQSISYMFVFSYAQLLQDHNNLYSTCLVSFSRRFPAPRNLSS